MDTLTLLLIVVFGTQQAITIGVAAQGELMTEKSGIINIGIEGVMLISAFTAAAANWYFGAPDSPVPKALMMGSASPWGALAVGMATGVLLNFFVAVMDTKLRVDQVISGIGINVFGLGLTYLISANPGLDRHYGFSLDGTPHANQLSSLFSVKGTYLSVGISPLVILLFGLPVLVWAVLKWTKFGLHVRAVGENPKSAEAAGLNVNMVRILATSIGGALLGLGGAYLTVDFAPNFTPDVTNGIGFIALAAVIAGAWNPFYTLVVSLIFGMSVGTYVVINATPGTPLFTFLAVLPYLVTVVALTITAKRLRQPSALGVPYKKE
ncbi:MAG TPA: ABC transporter permease [Nitrososphaerales archaeon]|nr:ABC transporter permease [Nitrososphaerales archaeon]